MQCIGHCLLEEAGPYFFGKLIEHYNLVFLSCVILIAAVVAKEALSQARLRKAHESQTLRTLGVYSA